MPKKKNINPCNEPFWSVVTVSTGEPINYQFIPDHELLPEIENKTKPNYSFANDDLGDFCIRNNPIKSEHNSKKYSYKI